MADELLTSPASSTSIEVETKEGSSRSSSSSSCEFRLFMVRHAQSVFNVDESNTELDCPLSPLGEKQAAALTGEFDVVVCSVHQRTRQTLGLSQIKAQRIVFSELCREWRIDWCDIMPGEEVWWETREQLDERIRKFKDWLRAEVGDAKTVLVVAHGDFCYHFGPDMPDLDNAQMVEVTKW